MAPRKKVDPIFQRMFKELYGKPCWGVKNCVGSDITFEFGEPHLVIREPIAAGRKPSRRVRELLTKRDVSVQGQWRLWIWICDWEIFQNGRRLGSHRTRSNMNRLVDSLDGQKLIRFSMDARGRRCTFEFDLGGVLVTTRPEPGCDHWQLFEPSGRALTLGADGKYSYGRSNQPHNAGPWKPVATPEK